MSTIRPDLPAVRPVETSPTQSGAVRSAQAAFFQAALAQVQSVQPQPQQPQARENRAPAPTPTGSNDTVRPPRPGSLLDIRV